MKYIVLLDVFKSKGGQERFIEQLHLNLSKKYNTYISKKKNTRLQLSIFLFKSVVSIILNSQYTKNDKIILISNSDRVLLLTLFCAFFFKILFIKIKIIHIHHINHYYLKKYKTLGLFKFYLIHLSFMAADICNVVRVYVNKKMIINLGKKRNIIGIDNGVSIKINNKHKENVITKSKQKFQQMIFIGRLGTQKNLINTIYALHECRNFNFKFDIYGEGELYNAINNLIKKLNMENKVSLKGYIANPADIIGKYNVLLQPSLFEGLSLSLLESWLYGLSIISTKDSLVPDWIANNNSCYISPDNTVDNISTTILRYFTDNLKDEVLIENRISKNIDIQRTFKNYSRVIKIL